jgi:prepilin-type N-terminal cleavage/methylation domain-containing protein
MLCITPKKTKHHKSRQGFTIVELLIVVVVIAILASITIASYNGVRKNAVNSSIQSTLSQSAKKIEMYRSSNPTNLFPASLSVAGLSLPSINGTLYVYSVSTDGSLYCLASSQSSRTYYISSTSLVAKAGTCNSTTGTAGTGDVATDGASSANTPVGYSVFNGQSPFTTQTIYNDGGGSLKIGNRFYTTEASGINVTGLRIFNPASADSTFLSLGLTAYAYTDSWVGTSIDGTPTFAKTPIATKTFSGARTAGAWTDILFNSSITLPAINVASGADDVISLAVQFAGGNHYVFVAPLPNDDTSIQSTARAGTYLAEHTGLGRGINSLTYASTNSFYGIDIIYSPVSP